ncbi:transcriptional regulator, DeoR family [Anaerosphaera aminiphila DSM 21120]|uniref:Transcriptional regulator, DeoR family n=1 Tax=Anaerosphaera aminiphila DSM 21120 TaxID=1120995 RepID=A0A1M5PI04_9FIRM|nr:DeoR/GlpR family DNA-binding transcription regulator [Anaerosphaera aminiphila]SHH01405.1 transcriptional regulator, DeoR family [Anaerosphaera aminiphila DSM 21120]
MLSVDRKNKIYSLFLEKKTLIIKELSKEFNVSEQTIRRDFKELEDGGIIKMAYGGGTLNENILSTKNVEFSVRQKLTIREKEEIAKLIYREIKEKESIFMDNSSTVLSLLNLMDDVAATIVTNAIMVSYELLKFKNVNPVQLGGAIDIRNKCTMDSICLEMLELYHFDKAFISCSSISMLNGITDSNLAISSIRKKVIEQSDKVYLLVDHTKFDKVSLVQISNFNKIDYLITNRKPSDEWIEFLKENNVELIFGEY